MELMVREACQLHNCFSKGLFIHAKCAFDKIILREALIKCLSQPVSQRATPLDPIVLIGLTSLHCLLSDEIKVAVER